MVKYDMEKVNTILEKYGYLKLSIGNYPTWINQKTKEGIEIKGGLTISFISKDGVKEYPKIDSEKIQKIKREITLSNEPIEALEAPKTPETKTDIIPSNIETKFVNQLSKVFAGEQIVAPQNIKELEEMPLKHRLLLFQKTDKKFVRRRKGFLLPSSARKSKESLTDSDYKWFSYVPANIMKMEANLAFGLLWSAEVESEKYFDNEVVVRGYVRVIIDKEIIRRPCGGSCVKRGLMDWGDTLEGAISEMIKRGLYSLGFNSDVKMGEFDEELKE